MRSYNPGRGDIIPNVQQGIIHDSEPKILTTKASYCNTDSLSHTKYVETKSPKPRCMNLIFIPVFPDLVID